MRKIFQIHVSFLLTLIVLASCQKREMPSNEKPDALTGKQAEVTPYYYYYKNEKHYLNLNKEYFFVSLKVNQNVSLPSGLPAIKTVQKKEDLSARMKKSFATNDDHFWGEYKIAAPLTDTAYFALLDQLKQDVNVETAAPYFKNNYGEKIGLSNFFYVKLKSAGEFGLLEKMSDEFNVVIVEQNKFMPLWYTLSCSRVSQLNAMQLANAYYESGQFEYAEPDLMVDNLLQCATDPLWTNQWNFLNTGQYGGTTGLDIKACGAWGITKGNNIKVAVIDDGIQLNHEDLIDNIHTLSYDVPTSSSPSVVRGSHGTACAGIIGANDNTIGVTGIAPNCKLMSVSCDLSAVNTTIAAGLANGINWSWTNGADVISNSWSLHSVTSSLVSDAISNALSLGRSGKGCVVVFASGNYQGSVGTSIDFPMNSNPNILVVGSMSQCGERKSFTSCDLEAWGAKYGAALDVMAPGVKIATTDRTGSDGYVSGNYELTFNGTSSACPQVAGIAALILSVNPNLTALQVRDIIEKNSEKVGSYSYSTTSGRPNGTWNQEMGYGLVNAHKAVLFATAVAPPTSGFEGRFYYNVMDGRRYIGMRGKYREFASTLDHVFAAGGTFNYININATPSSPYLGGFFPNPTFLPYTWGYDDPTYINTAYLNETSTGKWYFGEFKYQNPYDQSLTSPLQLDLTELTSIANGHYNLKYVTTPTAKSFIYYHDYAPLDDVQPIIVSVANTNDMLALSAILNPIYSVYNKNVYLNKLSNLTGH